MKCPRCRGTMGVDKERRRHVCGDCRITIPLANVEEPADQQPGPDPIELPQEETHRDRLARTAMPAIIATFAGHWNPNCAKPDRYSMLSRMAEMSYEMADFMLHERKAGAGVILGPCTTTPSEPTAIPTSPSSAKT